ncbi:hypothetical protein JYT95_01465 [bacterium AH-315-J23]|nr:hypothetical protein [bacterium AH-315-J23]
MSFNNEEETELSYHYFSDGKPHGGYDWTDLLEKRRIVILAEAGAGKTAEMIERSSQLNRAGQNSFYTTINALGRNQLRKCLVTRDIQRQFDVWLAGDDEAIIFADSLDEARLDGQNFLTALGNIEKDISEALDRVTIVLSSRVSDWRSIEDLNAFQNILCTGIRNRRVLENKKSKDWVLLNPAMKNGDDGEDKSLPLPDYKPAVVAIAPLTTAQATDLAKWRGVENTDEFLSAIFGAEAQALANRPQDLFGLVDLWNEKQQIGGKRDILDWSIKRRLLETNVDRVSDTLPSSEAMKGAKLIASCLTFGKKRFISWPINPSMSGLDDLTLNPKKLLSDWSNAKQAHLLNRAIFDPASLGRVRFHHRSVQEYLTALWLMDLIAAGCPRRKVWDIISSNIYGEYVLRPTFRPVCSWLGQLDEWFRTRISEIAPEVLIEGGDPSIMRVADRSILLEKFCKLYVNKDYTNVNIYLDQIQRLTDKGLGDKIRELWRQSKRSGENRQLLLRLIWVGEMKDCAAIAFEASTSRGRDYEKTLGIRALAKIGSKTQLKQFKKHIIKFAASSTSSVIGSAIETLYPGHITANELKEILKKYGKVNKRKRWRSRAGVDYNILNICKLSNKPDSIALVNAFAELAFTDPDTSRPRREPHNSKFYWLIDPAMLVLARLYNEHLPECKDDLELMGLARRFANAAAYSNSLSDGGGKELKKAIRKDRSLNRQFFWYSVHRAQNKDGDLGWYRQAYELGELWEIQESDFEWALNDIIEKTKPNDKFIALNVALTIWTIDRKNNTRLHNIKKVAGASVALNAEILKWEKPFDNNDNEMPRWKRRQRKNSKKWNKVKKNRVLSWLRFRDEVVANPDLIDGNENFGKLHSIVDWVDAYFRQSDGTIRDITPIGSAFSEEVLTRTRSELVKFWRTNNIRYPSSQGGQNPTNGIAVGLLGIDVESESDCNWQRMLSDHDVELATCYALHERLSVSEWASRLWVERKKLTQPILEKELEWEFSRVLKKGRSLYYLSHTMAYAKEPFRSLASTLCISVMERVFPKNEESLKNAIATITGAKVDHTVRLAKIAKREFLKARDLQKQARWMAIWIACTGQEAITSLEVWIGRARKVNRSRIMWEVLLKLYDHHDSTYHPPFFNFNNLAALERLVVLAHRYVEPCEDAIHEGSYTPDARDNVERARDGLFSLIQRTPGENTYNLIIKLISMPEFESVKQYYRASARRRAISDSDIKSWDPQTLVEFQTHFEKRPENQKELFEIALYRLDDIFDYWETGDYSLKRSLRQDHIDRADETVIQLALAKELEQRRTGNYSLEREPEVIDAKKPDIRLNNDAVSNGIPIEIKVADSWSYRELKQAIKDQLIGLYMRSQNERYGILVLSYHGKKGYWRQELKGQKAMDINQLSLHLQEYANELVYADNALERIDIVTVDLR